MCYCSSTHAFTEHLDDQVLMRSSQPGLEARIVLHPTEHRTWIMDGSLSAAAIHCLTALGLSATGKSHHVSHAGVSGFARNVGTCGHNQQVCCPWQHG